MLHLSDKPTIIFTLLLLLIGFACVKHCHFQHLILFIHFLIGIVPMEHAVFDPLMRLVEEVVLDVARAQLLVLLVRHQSLAVHDALEVLALAAY